MPLGRVKAVLKRTLRRTGMDMQRLVIDDRATYVQRFGQSAVQRRAFYNISAGGHFGFGGDLDHPCWTNVDLDRPWPGGRTFDAANGDIAHDLLSLAPLPLASDSAELVHSRVTIEHITNEAAAVLFREVHRVLKPGALFRVVCPNIELDFRALAADDLAYFSWADPTQGITMEQAFLAHFAANAAVTHPDGAPQRITDAELRRLLATLPREAFLDHCVARCSLDVHRRHRGDHINWWTPAKVEAALRSAGFETVYPSANEQSACPVLRNTAHFDNRFSRFMLYMEAVKAQPPRP